MTPNSGPAPASTEPQQRSPLGLGPLETAIMHTLWDATGWVTITGIRAAMDYGRPVAHTTVATVAGILCAKGMAQRELGRNAGQSGPAIWWYRPARSHDEHTGELIAALLAHTPSPQAALAHAMAISPAPIHISAPGSSSPAGHQAHTT